MKLLRLNAHMFRNLEEVDLSFGSRFNIFYGDNAQGKTNLLEAIFLLGTIKSFRTAKNTDLIAWGQPASILHGWVDKEGVPREISLVVERQGKKVRIDQKAVARIGDFFGSLNVVVFSPEDLAMVKGGPEMRRRYLDRAVFSSDLGYLRCYNDYAKILKNRNAVLKHGDKESLGIWSRQLADTGAKMIVCRLEYLHAINPLVQEFYREISGTGEVAGIVYKPHLLELQTLKENPANMIIEALEDHYLEEQRRATTIIGPHRDDIDFILEGNVLKNHASQGQQRTFILAVKMAEIEYLRDRYLHPPVLLLDDMTAELDRKRNENLMDFLSSREMQVFITTTNVQNIMLDGIEQYPAFHVKSGKVVHETRGNNE